MNRKNSIIGLSWRKIKSGQNYEEMDDEHEQLSPKPITRSQSRLTAIQNFLSTKAGETFGGSSNHKQEQDEAAQQGFQSEVEGQHRFLQRTKSFRVAVTSLKQKLRVNTKRKKRLSEGVVTPYISRSPHITHLDDDIGTPGRRRSTMITSHSVSGSEFVTPENQYQRRRRSSRSQSKSPMDQQIKLYSPFRIDTPSSSVASRTPNRIKMGVNPQSRRRGSDKYRDSPGQITRDINDMALGIQSLTSITDDINNKYQLSARRRSASKSKLKTQASRSRNSISAFENEAPLVDIQSPPSIVSPPSASRPPRRRSLRLEQCPAPLNLL